MMNRQLKIWKEDFFRCYNRTSVMMRIIIGAILSLGTAYFLTARVIKPQNLQLKALKQKFGAMELIDDVELQTADLKNKQRKISRQIEGLKTVNEKLALTLGDLSRGEIGKNILDLRFLMDRNNLKIVSEERVLPEKTVRRRSRVKPKSDDRVKIRFPSSMSCESYRFKVLGSYQNLRRFLTDVRNAQAPFFLNNIRITCSGEMLTDRNLNQYRALSCSFEVHVPFRTGTPAQGGSLQ